MTKINKDPKADIALYNYLSTFAYDYDGETRLFKSDVPSFAYIGEMIQTPPMARQTVSNHFKYLLSQGYIIDAYDYYILPQANKYLIKDKMHLFTTTLNSQVLSLYTYICDCYNNKQYTFTLQDICTDLELDYTERNQTALKNRLAVLQILDFIQYEQNQDTCQITYCYKGTR